ncbi:hypothetical protein DPM19_30970 [Actinomadura craniellae]|uniref:Scramblase n=1 Tax=Actinomadura craniellae TaxID=2231787 RepID=A0A365GX93_9ACTN|nr:phospholipid scramblase-related protein [Actinomadura craniellae]RAY11440.1 hypothetical protein DPM19_30970 [Actinomadura craniellae]
MSDLFDFPSLRIEQPRKVLANKVAYKILDPAGNLLATAEETTVRGRREQLRAALPGHALFGDRTFHVTSPAEELLLVMEKLDRREGTRIKRPDGDLIGMVRPERTNRHYGLFDAADQRIGEIVGEISLRRFTVKDATGRQAALINKKWAGVATELFTHSDRYTVEFDDRAEEPLRTIVAITVILLDLILHESKDVV